MAASFDFFNPHGYPSPPVTNSPVIDFDRTESRASIGKATQPLDLPASPASYHSSEQVPRGTPQYSNSVLRDNGLYHEHVRASPSPKPETLTTATPLAKNGGIARNGTMKGSGFVPVRKLGVADFFSLEVFQAVLHNPTTAHRFLRFCQTRLCGENMEFLQMVDSYHSLLEEVTHTLSSIHRMYTSPEAPRQINVGHNVMKTICANMKQVTTSGLTSMETIFFAAQDHVERLLATDIYPRFVKHQITASAAMALADHRERFQGLGDCFCLTDPAIADNPIVFASDGFVSVTGYSRRDIIPRNCASCKTVELLLNYRKNGEPFWNLLYIAPLLNEHGEVAFFLGGQINCNITIHSYNDVLRVLSINDEDADLEFGGEDNGRSIPGSIRGVGASMKVKKKGPFFKSWKRAPVPAQPKVFVKDQIGMEGELLGRIGRLNFQTQVETFYTAYSKYLLMPYTSPNHPLPIAHYSPGVVDMLCLNLPNGQIAPIFHKDIFKVLSEYSSASSSTTKALRNTVREAMKKGCPVSAEMGLLTGFEEVRMGSGAFRWGREPRDDEAELKMRRKLERYVSHWTPLKDEEGKVRWVVLIIAPK